MAADFTAAYRDLDVSATITMRSGKQFVVPATEIYSYSINSTAASSGLPMGEAVSATFSLGVTATSCPYTGEELDGAEVRVRMGVRSDPLVEYEYEDAGAWYITSVGAPEGSSALTLNGSDALALFFDSVMEDSTAAYPQSLASLLGVVCAVAGVTVSNRPWFNSDAAIAELPVWPENTTLRSIVGYIAACAGGFAQIDMSGRLEIITSGQGNTISVTPETYNSFTPSGGNRFAFNCLRVVYPITDEDAAKSETIRYAIDASIADNATNCVVIENNPLITDAIAHSIMERMTGLEYIGGQVVWLGDPRVMPGYTLKITALDGIQRVGFINSRQLTFDGGLSGTAVSNMPALHDTSTHYSSSGRPFNPDGTISVTKIQGMSGAVVNAMLGKFDRILAGDITTDTFFAKQAEIVQLAVQNFEAGVVDAKIIKAETITADKIAAESLTADKIAAHTITTEKIKAGAIDAARIAAGAIVAEKIGADAITANHIKAGTITGEKGIIAEGAIGTAQIADGSITSAKVVDLNADVIKAGTLSVERLLLVGEDGIIHRINASSSGVSASELSKDEYKRYLDGTVIVAKSITAAQIAAQSITGNEILAGTITAKEIDVSDLFAAEATIEQLEAMDISGNKYLRLIVEDIDDQIAQIEQRVASAELMITPESIISTVTSSETYINDKAEMQGGIDGNASAIATHTTQIQQLDSSIKLAATKTEVNTLSGRVDTAEAKIDLIPDKIELAVSSMTMGVRNYLKDSGIAKSVTNATSSGDIASYYFGSDTPQVGKTYTIRIWGSISSSLVTFNPLVWGSKDGTYAGYWFGGSGTKLADGSYVYTDTWTVQSVGNLGVRVSGSASSVRIDKIMLSEGSTVSDWTPSPDDPSSGVKTSYIEIEDDHIDIGTGGSLNINSGMLNISTGDYVMSLVKNDGDEVVMDVGDDGYTTLKGIHAGNVREAVYGTLAHTTATLGSLTGLASLLMTTDARHVEYTMTKDEYVDVTFSQFSGSVKINANGHRLPFIFVDGSFSGSIMIDNGILTGATRQALSVENGRVFLYNCWFAGGSTQGIYAYFRGEVNWVNGASTPPTSIKLTQYLMWAHVGGTIRYNGYIPGGEIWCGANLGHVIAGDHVTVLSPASGSGGGTVDTTKSASVTGTLGWISDKQSWKTGVMYQGYTTGKGKCYGCVKFTLPTASSIISATLTLHRVSGVGKGSAVDVKVYGSTTTWGSRPTLGIAYTNVADAADNGQYVTVDATAAAQALFAGTIKQLVLYQSDDTATLSGKVYSTDYAQWDSAVIDIVYE